MANGKKEIVFINQSTGYLMVDIINAHDDFFGKKILMTGSLATENGERVKFSIKKIKKYDRSSTLKRLFTWILAFFQILWKVKTYHRKSYLFIVSNPPFAPFLPLFCKNSFSLLIYDIYPDLLVDYEIFSKNSVIVKFWEKLNSRVYKKADKVFTISEGMENRISEYLPEERIKVVSLWANEEYLKPIAKKKNKFVKENGLEDKFVVLYSGNLGKTHDLETLIYAAERIKRDDILFLIIGGGDKKSKLQEMIREKELGNVIMKPWQPIEMLPYTLNSADLGVVTLGRGASDLSLPSKTFNYISVGAPLLCIAESSSELAKLVDKYDMGGAFRSTEIDEIVDYILSLADDKKQYNNIRNNVIKASNDFSKDNAKKFVSYS